MAKSGIAVAEYWTDMPPKNELERKIQEILAEVRMRTGRAPSSASGRSKTTSGGTRRAGARRHPERRRGCCQEAVLRCVNGFHSVYGCDMLLPDFQPGIKETDEQEDPA
jgi:hypothetical protein